MSRLVASALGLIGAPIVSRAIGPEGRGETAAAAALFYLIPIVLAMGVPLEVRRLAATANAAESIRGSRIISALAFFPSVGLGLASYLTIFSTFDEGARLVASAGIAAAPFTMSWMTDASVLIAQKRFRALFLMQIAQPVTYVVLVTFVWATGIASTASVLVAALLGNVVTFVLGAIFSSTSMRGPRVAPSRLFKSGLAFAGSAIAEAASNRLDQVLVLPIVGSLQAGLYSVSVTVGSLPLALGHALGASFFAPIAQADEPKRSCLQAEAARAGLAIGLLSSGILAVLAPFAIPLLFGPQFEAAVVMAEIVLIGSVAMVAAYVCSMALAATGKGLRMTVAQVVSLMASIGLLYLLAPEAGGIGAAWASVGAYVVLFLMLAVFLGVGVRALLPRPKDVKLGLRYLARGR